MDMTRDATFWCRQLDLADREEKEWRERVKEVLKRYRSESKDGPARFNILWANTQVQFAAMYSARPKPDVRRRHRSKDDIGRAVSTALERAIEWSMDSGYDFDRMCEKLVLDYLLPGRIVARCKYHPFFKVKTTETMLAEEPEELGERETVEQREFDGIPYFVVKTEFDDLVAEEVRAYHVPWDQYRQAPADCWDDVWWIAYGNNFLTLDEIKDQFGEEFDDVPLEYSDQPENMEGTEDTEIKKAQVWEIWDKEQKKVYAVVKGYGKVLMEVDDPLKLNDFYPGPEPAQMIETPNSMIPLPEYTMYQCQAEELNTVTRRIEKLADAMKVKGFYPGESVANMNNLIQSDETMLIPVDDWAAHAEKGGLSGMIDWMPVKDIADTWQRLIIHRQQIIASIYELIGISDIQRGASDPRETRGAQQLKANYGARRLIPKQQRFQRFIRDLLRIKAEIMSEHFRPETLSRISGVQITPEMEVVMKSDMLRSFTIDIETDSTVAPDEEREKQGVAEFMAALSTFVQQTAPIVASEPSAAKPVGSMLLWLSRKFKIARDVEQEIEDFVSAMQQQQGRRNTAEDAKAASEAQKAKAEIGMKQQKMQMELKLDEVASQREEARKDRELAADIRRKDIEAKARIERENALAGVKESREARKLSRDIAKERAEAKEESGGSKVVELVYNEDGSILGAEMRGEGGALKRVEFVRNEDGKAVGGKIVA